MIKGQQTITSIFIRDTPKVSKGSADRDECLCFRYYYYYVLMEKRHDLTLEALESEFFVSQDTVTKRLTANASFLKVVTTDKPNKTALKRKYPHLVW
ncbi:hypothetical protein [Sphingobacterium sp.]|uniref:hypothetical protein n=1 Tax=Sphingobacterium sp. TaxID=341027 RepID=UPI00289AF61F|nr:hypothetical protein [Sphingobacterium sp.]